MKYLIFIGLFPFSLQAQQKDATEKREVIVLEGPSQKSQPAPLFVESGTDKIVGESESSLRGAHRMWEQKCETWKAELFQWNGRNLIFASCGEPKLSQEKTQEGFFYHYQSTGTYKIKVIGK